MSHSRRVLVGSSFRPGWAWVAVLAGCTGEGSTQQGPPLTDTGWFQTPTDPLDPATCPDRFVNHSPGDGADSWYYRDRPEGFTATNNPDAYDAWLQTARGERVPAELVWDDSGLSFTLEWDGWLAASTTYELGLTDCAGLTVSTFTTSSLGQPLEVDLVGNTYLLDLVGAEWVQPPQLSALLALYFNTPILLSVTRVDEASERIDLLGAPGIVDQFGTVTQDRNGGVWDFPFSDFSESPFVRVLSDEITLEYVSGNTRVDVPVQDFLLEGTFTANGDQLAGGVLSGLADSRSLSAGLLDEDNPGALCDLAAGLGVFCQPCADGQSYCLYLEAADLGGELVPGLEVH